MRPSDKDKAYQIILTYWIMPAAAGATCPKVWTCAITSWRRFFSSTAAISNCSGVRCCEEFNQSSGLAEESEQTHQVRLHLLNRLIRDRQPELFFRDRKVQPQLPPRVEAVLEEVYELS